MKFKGTFLLVAVFIGIVLYYFLMEIPAGEKKKEAKELSEKVLVFRTSDVDELSITSKDQSIVVERKGGGPWQITQPLKVKADAFAVEAFIDKLHDAHFSRVVEEEPEDLSAYGLKTPSLKIALKVKDQPEMVLLVGDMSPIGESFYVKRSDQKKVLLTKNSLKDWNLKVFDLRDKTVLFFNTQDVTEAELYRGGTLVRFTKKDKVWSVAGAIAAAKGDAKNIEDLLNSVRASRVSAFVEETPKDLTAFGLNPPAIRLTIQSGENSPRQHLLIGSQNDKGRYYAKTNQAENVFALDATLVGMLSKKELDFLDKSLFEIKEENVAELRLRNRDENVQIVRDKLDQKLWKIEQPVNNEGDNTALNSLLADLKDAHISEYIGNTAADFKAHGLDSPQKQLTILTKENKSLVLRVGGQSDDKKLYYAAREGEPTVFTLSTNTVEKIFPSLQDLRNKKLLKFKVDEVAKINIQYPNKTLELSKQGEDWSLLQPEQIKKIKPFVAKDILWALNNLEFDAIENSVKDEAGLNHPTAQITIADKQNKTMKTLLIGKQTADKSQYYAQVEGIGTIYRIKERFLGEIPNNTKKFKD